MKALNNLLKLKTEIPRPKMSLRLLLFVIGFEEMMAFIFSAARSLAAKGEREDATKAGPTWRPILQYGCPPYPRIDPSKNHKKKELIYISIVYM